MTRQFCQYSVKRTVRNILLAATLISASWAAVTPATADSVQDFYKNNHITIVVGSPPGASYDAYGRILARHFGNHLPGNPDVIITNRPGAGSLSAANTLYNDPRKDGATLGMLGQSIYFMQMLDIPNVEYDAPKYNWIGRMTNVIDVVVVWHDAKVKNLADAYKMPVSVAVGGATSGSTLYVNFMNAMLGTKIVPTKGYESAEAFLAMQRGEVDGTGSANWYGLQAQHGDELRDKKLNILVQIGLNKAPGLEDVPLFPDLAKNEHDRKILVALATTDEIARTVVAPPGVPKERIDALRRGFMETMKSDAFLADAQKAHLAINPMDGEALTKLVIDSGSGFTPEMIADIKKMANK
jgi:tripartite-type tricarboxylate transporter receptor subunit TctC